MMENQIVKTTTSVDFFNPASMEAATKACELFVHSSLVPEIYRETEKNDLEKAKSNVFIALEMASRIGASPLMVMQNLYMVKGKPSWSSSFLIATVNTCGRFKPLKFYMGTEGEAILKNGQKIPNLTCVAYTCEKEIAKEDEKANNLASTKITMQMAINEGWYDKDGSKWKTMPEQMIRYRAASFWVRTYAPEIAMGMYTVEENEDIVDVNFEEDKPDFSKANQGGPIGFEEEAQNEPQKSESTEAEQEEATHSSWRERAKKTAPTDNQPGF